MSTLTSACYAIGYVKPFLNQEILRKFYFSYFHSVFIMVIFSWEIQTFVIVSLRYKILELLRIQEIEIHVVHY